MHRYFSGNIALIDKVLDLSLQRQNIVSANLANINVDGYKGRHLNFEKDLQDAVNSRKHPNKMVATDEDHVGGSGDIHAFMKNIDHEFKPRVVHGADSVNFDEEMTAMGKNAMLYNALSQIMNGAFAGLNKVVKE